MSNPFPALRIAPLLLACGWAACLGAVCLGAVYLWGSGSAVAQQPPRAADEAGRGHKAVHPSERPEREALSTEAREAAALELVRRHLPQLNALLKSLRSGAPEQYERAISDLARQARRLEASQRRDPRLFEIELEILKRQTRVDLGVARLQLRDDPKTRQQLRRALGDLQQARRARLAYEREQLQQRIERLEQQLHSVEERLEAPLVASPEWIDKAYKNLLRRAGRAAETASATAQETDGIESETPGSSSR